MSETKNKKPIKTDDPFDESNEVQSNWVKFNVPKEDKIFGTLIAKRTMKSTMPGKEGTPVHVYELKADYGSFHKIDDTKKVIPEAIEVNENEIWSIGGTAVIDRQMKNIRIGQKIGLKFIEEKPAKTKGFAPAKIIKVYAPKNEDGTPQMDQEWLEASRDPEKDFNDF